MTSMIGNHIENTNLYEEDRLSRPVSTLKKAKNSAHTHLLPAMDVSHEDLRSIFFVAFSL